MNDMYYIKISELPVINSRTQKEFDEILLEYIEKFKSITMDVDIISHLIATSIDYPFEYVKETISTYIRSGLLSYNLVRIFNKDAFVREKLYVKGYKAAYYFIYDRKNNILKEIDQTQIKDYEDRKEKKVELDNSDYRKIYSNLFYYDDFFNRETKEKDKYLMSLTVRKIEEDSYREFFGDKIEFYSLKTLPERQTEKLKEKTIKEYKDKLRRYEENYKFLNEIKNGKGYYEYNLASSSRNDSESCDDTIVELLDIARDSIFIISTNINSEESSIKTKAFEKMDDLKNEGKHYIRAITGFKNAVDRIYVEQDKNYYLQEYANMIHSKIIVVDNFFVALGSGNWFTSRRDRWEDSLVIFPCDNAIKSYCPIYYPKSDYYKIFEQLIEEKNELNELFDLYLIMKKDLEYHMSSSKNVYDELLIKKIEKSIEENIEKDFDIIEKFLKEEKTNKDVFYDYLSSSSNIDKKYKEKLRNIYNDRGDN